jgi:hypothetical protein
MSSLLTMREVPPRANSPDFRAAFTTFHTVEGVYLFSPQPKAKPVTAATESKSSL